MYRPGTGAVDPDGTGDGISRAEPCVLVAFLRGVLLTALAVLVAPVVSVVPDFARRKKPEAKWAGGEGE
jgi:hypothetical protein